MGDFNFSNSFGNSNNQSNGFALKYAGNSGSFSFAAGDSFPLLTLPKDFNVYEWKGVSEVVNGETILVPEIDKILTEYSNNRLKTLFTIEFLEFVDQQFPLFSFPKENNKLSYAVNLYLTISGYFPLMYGDEARKTLSFYIGSAINPNNPFNMSNPFSDSNNIINVGRAELSLTLLEQTYANKLTQAFFHRPGKNPQGKPFQINEPRARQLINVVNKEMEADVDVYFVNARARARQILPDDVKNDERYLASMHDATWNEYDETIKRDVAFYNKKFSGTPGFVPLDWRYVKAMLWTEVKAGPKGNPTQWTTYPMQIGRFADDKGYVTVRDAKTDEGADFVVENELKQQVQDKNNVFGQLNVRAGIAYLYIRAIGSIRSDDKTEGLLESYVVTGEDKKGFSGIAQKLGTTIGNLEKNNPDLKPNKLLPGTALKYQKATSVRNISGWKDWMTAILNYNIGDPDYRSKVEKAYQIIISRTPQ